MSRGSGGLLYCRVSGRRAARPGAAPTRRRRRRAESVHRDCRRDASGSAACDRGPMAHGGARDRACRTRQRMRRAARAISREQRDCRTAPSAETSLFRSFIGTRSVSSSFTACVRPVWTMSGTSVVLRRPPLPLSAHDCPDHALRESVKVFPRAGAARILDLIASVVASFMKQRMSKKRRALAWRVAHRRPASWS